ncbi:MAG: AAA family ATPase [ANME-2 cluster archaeon]|nr:AAA family ATPase [ANME-2 cluster archaeon]
MKNFRPFKGEQTIDFLDDSQEKFTIIEAKADTGKTTFLSAICWCLYGKDLGEEIEENSHPFNLEKKDELSDGESDTMEVEITLNDDGKSTPKYVISRNAYCMKYGNDMEYDGYYNPSVLEWKGNEATPINNAAYCDKIINSILPEDIHMFFLFEGEKLEKIFSLYDSANIEAAVEKVSQIQQLKLALKHLEVSRDKVYSDKSKGQDNKEILKNERAIENIEKELEALEKQKGVYKIQLDTAEQRIIDIDKILSEVNIPLINEWIKNRASLEIKNNEHEEKIKSIQDELNESLLKNAPLALCSKPILNLLEIIETSKIKGELPPKIKNVYIEELLQTETCLCGRSLDINGNEEAKNGREALIKMLEQKDLSDLSDNLIDGKFVIKNLFEVLPYKLIDWRKSKLDIINAKRNEINGNLAEIENINAKLKDINEEDIKTLDHERTELRNSKNPQIRSITELENKIRKKNDDRIIKRRENDIAARKLDNYNSMKVIADFMDRAYEHLYQMTDEILEEVRNKVEKKTFESFQKLHWDKHNYKDFEIDEIYNMSLRDSKGNEKIGDISSGTKQVLLLSFIAALADVSGFKFPIFIDTPLANTDNEQRENIWNNLPNFLDGNQVVLLVKDQEYTTKYRSIISKNISQEYRLVKIEGHTEVRQWD